MSKIKPLIMALQKLFMMRLFKYIALADILLVALIILFIVFPYYFYGFNKLVPSSNINMPPFLAPRSYSPSYLYNVFIYLFNFTQAATYMSRLMAVILLMAGGAIAAGSKLNRRSYLLALLCFILCLINMAVSFLIPNMIHVIGIAIE